VIREKYQLVSCSLQVDKIITEFIKFSQFCHYFTYSVILSHKVKLTTPVYVIIMPNMKHIIQES